ncbi:hypothetical protein [Streptomyces fulvorobeus]|uniref:Uncharacterized protein n=1 Tax=Streptomyces fulvorobeus TaxID=284028 RepID=A0A7J0BYI4_9ACTN|nr:hypothetical protein [Streptomyces fulvorobeus]NYE39093.1 hypothetical protein [Streptomyces fulvorobeus]GFM95292.1 hypothetical protein Sfulv_01030 [Streptomyces fulvorobeus]
MTQMTDESVLWLAPPQHLPHDLATLREAADRLDRHHPAPDHRRLPERDPREAAFDEFFAVARCACTPALLLIDALDDTLATVRAFSRNPDGSLTEPDLDLAAHAAGLIPRTGLSESRTQATVRQRWIQGHRLFFALTQATVIALRHALRAPSPAGSALGLESAAHFLRASASALRITASFDAQAYHDTVRPSMAPPQAPRGFSGLWSADHRVLVQSLREWGLAAPARSSILRPAHRRLVEVLTDVHHAHVGVCSRFVGSGPSLLRGAEPGVQVLDRLCQRRRTALDAAPDGRPAQLRDARNEDLTLHH